MALVRRFSLKTIGLFAAALCGLMAFALPAAAAEFSAGQRSEIEVIIKNYLMQNPEVLRDAINELESRQKTAENEARLKFTTNMAGPLYSSPHQAIIGNPNGKITLVEFFDYNCGYCKRALDDLARLMKDNPDLKVVLKDFPILTPGSIEAAKVASAARNQFKGDKYWDYHRKLLSARGEVGKTQALAIAQDLGADMGKLNKDAQAADVTAGIEETMDIAKSLSLNGTPSYVVGEEVVVGAVGYDDLKLKLDNVRKCGKAACS